MKDIHSINNQLYIYEGFDENLKLHKCSEVMLDRDGNITATLILAYFNDEELTHDSIDWITKKQWYGIVEAFIHYYHNGYLTPEEITDATEDIVGRSFAYGIPKMHELYDYINEHLDR